MTRAWASGKQDRKSPAACRALASPACLILRQKNSSCDRRKVNHGNVERFKGLWGACKLRNRKLTPRRKHQLPVSRVEEEMPCRMSPIQQRSQVGEDIESRLVRGQSQPDRID